MVYGLKMWAFSAIYEVFFTFSKQFL